MSRRVRREKKDSLPSLALRFQLRSGPFARLLARIRLRKKNCFEVYLDHSSSLALLRTISINLVLIRGLYPPLVNLLVIIDTNSHHVLGEQSSSCVTS